MNEQSECGKALVPVVLLTCPFCGSQPKFAEFKRLKEFEVHCNGCGATIALNNKAMVLKNWNTRVR